MTVVLSNPKSPAASLEDALTKLTVGIFTVGKANSALSIARSVVTAYEDATTEQSAHPDYLQQPGLIPAAKLIEGYALAANNANYQALEIVKDEVARIIMGEFVPWASATNADAVLAFHAVLGTHLTRQRSHGRVAQIYFEKLADRVAANQPRSHDPGQGGQDMILLMRSSFYSTVEQFVGTGLGKDLANLSLVDLLTKLVGIKNILLKPVVEGAYSMQETATSFSE